MLMAFGNQHQGTIERKHFIQKDRDVHCAWLWHPVFFQPVSIVLMPLPDVAGELGLCVDLVLVEIDAFAIHLHQWLNQPRMATERVENLRIAMNSERGSGRAVLFQINLVARQGEQTVRLPLQDINLFLTEIIGQEQPALIAKLLQLRIVQFHRVDPPSDTAITFSPTGGKGVAAILSQSTLHQKSAWRRRE